MVMIKMVIHAILLMKKIVYGFIIIPIMMEVIIGMEVMGVMTLDLVEYASN